MVCDGSRRVADGGLALQRPLPSHPLPPPAPPPWGQRRKEESGGSVQVIAVGGSCHGGMAAPSLSSPGMQERMGPRGRAGGVFEWREVRSSAWSWRAAKMIQHAACWSRSPSFCPAIPNTAAGGARQHIPITNFGNCTRSSHALPGRSRVARSQPS